MKKLGKRDFDSLLDDSNGDSSEIQSLIRKNASRLLKTINRLLDLTICTRRTQFHWKRPNFTYVASRSSSSSEQPFKWPDTRREIRASYKPLIACQAPQNWFPSATSPVGRKHLQQFTIGNNWQKKPRRLLLSLQKSLESLTFFHFLTVMKIGIKDGETLVNHLGKLVSTLFLAYHRLTGRISNSITGAPLESIFKTMEP